MALDIGLESTSNSNYPLAPELIVSLEEGDLAFLRSASEELLRQTGVVIDAYIDARLQGESLIVFEKLLLQKQSEAELKPDQWQEYTGLQVHPSRKEIYATLSKAEVLDKLNDLLKLTRQASEQNRALYCFGD